MNKKILLSMPVLFLLWLNYAINATNCVDVCSASCPEVSCRDGRLFCKTEPCKDECVPCKGFFLPRPITTNLLYQDPLAYYYLHHKHAQRFAYNGTLLFEKNRHAFRLARLLLQGLEKCEVLVAQNDESHPDINAAWLNLSSTNANGFTSKFKIHPERKIVGINNQFYFDLGCCLSGVWADITFAFVHARHNLNLCEDVQTPGTTNLFINVASALDNSQWNAGRFCNQTLTRNSIDDVQFRLGWQWPACNYAQWGMYLIGVAPTGKSSESSECIFSPFVGSSNGSFGFGINGDYILWDNPIQQTDLVFMVDANYRYVLEHHACRSFDLCSNGRLSRYMLVALENNPSISLPAINFFTQRVLIEPRSTAQLWTALRYGYCDVGLEGGYNLWWRQREKINGCFFVCDQERIGIFDIANRQTSASTATISQGVDQVVSDSVFTPIDPAQFDTRSGAAPSTLTHQLYIALSWKGGPCLPFMMGVGGGVEFGAKHKDEKCAGVENWMLFIKALVGF